MNPETGSARLEIVLDGQRFVYEGPITAVNYSREPSERDYGTGYLALEPGPFLDIGVRFIVAEMATEQPA
jgi:hypothetical protein